MSDDPQRVMYMWLIKREKEKSRLKNADRKYFFCGCALKCAYVR